MRLAAAIALAVAALGCGTSGGAAPDGGGDAHREAGLRDARGDSTAHDGSREAEADAPTILDANADAPARKTALVRLANWSPDAPLVDFCIAPHGSSLWSGPVLAGALGSGVFGKVTVVDAAIPVDAGSHVLPPPDASPPDASPPDASPPDASARDAPPSDGAPSVDAPSDAQGTVDAAPEAESGAATTGVSFPRISPYVSLTPGQYDVRVVSTGAGGCSSPLFADTTDLAPFVAGSDTTLATVGEVAVQGSDPGISIVAFADEGAVPAGVLRLRFINAVPSVIETTLETGAIVAHFGVEFTPLLLSAQFGDVAADAWDGGALDQSDYLSLSPVTSAYWAIYNANGGLTPLMAVENVSLASGQVATAVAIGGESGPDQGNIGILLCVDQPPIIAGETAKCDLYEGSGLTAPICPSCP